ncbi:hypothetical protein [Paenibacillus tianjinensis]|uniref:PD-(D/E)XK nuclease superfamily protein n=1 Tax=Paenibacillus tianjinensis TaxID=2810347 RepID=A0ABX7LAH9_9BACL|nr:hypothetical protein [Paenibacillus tianjinensis]QSF42992.1 hypothetical protein JRJ22_17010 [Paenibacillus tianjinensis]
MINGTLSVKLRPLKFAIIIEPYDTQSLETAIYINSYLWGGTYNPIIPAFSDGNGKISSTDMEMIEGYVFNFDPDYIVNLSKVDLSETYLHEKLISIESIMDLENIENNKNYGTSVFHILDVFCEQELKYQRREQLQIVHPIFQGEFELFLSSVFGSLQAQLNDNYLRSFVELYNVKKAPCSLENFTEYLEPDILFLRRITSKFLNISRRNDHHCSYIFFMDASSPVDIIDFWNLRALGLNILPVPKQIFINESSLEIVQHFIESSFFPLKSNSEIYHNTTIQKSRQTSEEELSMFLKQISFLKQKEGYNHSYVIREWFPRLWIEDVLFSDDAICCEITSRSERISIQGEKRLEIKVLRPDFHIDSFKPMYVNELNWSVYNQTELLSEIIPEGDNKLIRILNNTEINNWKISRRGLSYFCDYTDTIRFSIPNAKDTFGYWMQLNGWETALSNSGRIAEQMMRHLGGPQHLSIISQEKLVQLLLNISKRDWITDEEFRKEINIIMDGNAKKYADGFINTLLKTKMIKLGIRTQCPVCTHYNWDSLDKNNYSLNCGKCLSEYEMPSYNTKLIKWAYKSFGPFSLPNSAYGVYCVLLTYRFFAQILDGTTTTLLSSTASKNNKKIEFDLALHFKMNKFDDKSRSDLLFCECKTHNLFEKNDISRMRELAREFPKAIIVFSTMKPKLNDNEKLLISEMIYELRRERKERRLNSDVLILTGIELYSEFHPTFAWENLGGAYQEKAKNYRWVHDIKGLCAATQNIHLDIESYEEWIRQQ